MKLTHQCQVGANGAGWLDRPFLSADSLLLTHADLQGTGGDWTFLEIFSRQNGERLAHLTVESQPGQEVFPSRIHCDSSGYLWVSVYVQNCQLRLYKLHSNGSVCQSWSWDSQDYSELAAFDLSCKLFPGPVGQLGGRPVASWLYRQGRDYQMVTPDSGPGVSLARAWPVHLGEDFFLATDGQDLWSQNAAGQRLWNRNEAQLLAIYRSWAALLEPEGEQVSIIDLETGHNLETVSFPGFVRSLGGFDGEHMAVVWDEPGEERHRIHCHLPGQEWELSFPGTGAAWLGYSGEESWWCDDKYWHCRDAQGKSSRSGRWPDGFRALGYGPRICDRGVLWPNAVWDGKQLWARYGEELLLWEF